MTGLLARLNTKASESQTSVALVVAAVGMGLMLWAIVWQANVITYQHDLIKWMLTMKFGG